MPVHWVLVASIQQNQHNDVYTKLAWGHQLRINGNYVNCAYFILGRYLGDFGNQKKERIPLPIYVLGAA
jgi:hypothetical protein